MDTISFTIGELWNDTFEKVMMAVVLAYFGGRTTESKQYHQEEIMNVQQ